MLREARLLESLSHECIVPLERGWLEQRTGSEQPHICACAVSRSSLLRNTTTIGSEDVDDTLTSAERREAATDVLEEGCLCLRQPRLWSAATPATGDSLLCGSVRLLVESCCGLRSEDDAVAFLLRSWVPLTVNDVEVDDDEYDVAEQDEGDEMAGSNKNIGKGGIRSISQYGGLEQLRWGGDGTTGWRGTAEPKSTADGAICTTNTSAADSSLDRKIPNPITATEGCCCSCAYRGQVKVDDGGKNLTNFLYGERIVCLASYLLLPDWLPLSVWFETEFEPRTATSDEQGGAETTGVVTAPDDWALVWRHLLSMFVQVSVV